MLEYLRDVSTEFFGGLAAALVAAVAAWLFMPQFRARVMRFPTWLRENRKPLASVAIAVVAGFAIGWYGRDAPVSGGAQRASLGLIAPQLREDAWTIALADSFETADSKNHWPTGRQATDAGPIDIVIRSKLRLELDNCEQNASLIRFAYLAESEEITDGLISVDARLLKGNAADDYGIVFRSQFPEMYYFEVSELNRSYRLSRGVEDGWETLLPETFDEVVAAGEVNNLAVSFEGHEIELYVNGKHLASVVDDEISRGKVGVGADYRCPGGQIVEFDNFQLYTPR